jgi:hypothetical protein
LAWREQRLAAPRRDLGKTRCTPRVERPAPHPLSRPGSALLASCALGIRVRDHAGGCGAGTPVPVRGSCQPLPILVHRPLGGTTVPGEGRGEAASRDRGLEPRAPGFDGLAAQQAACETPQAIAICASNDIVATDPGAEHDATGQSLEAPHRDGAAAGISARADLKRQPDKPCKSITRWRP